MIGVLVAASLMASEVLALINGHPVTRADLKASLAEAVRRNYTDAQADLQDFEHAAVRDYLGRQVVQGKMTERHEPADSIYARVLADDFGQLDPNLRNRIQQQREIVYNIEKSALDALVDNRLFEAAARAKGMSPEALTAVLSRQVAPVTKRDIDFIKAYENSKQEISATVPPGEARLEAAIRAARAEQLRTALVDSARAHGLVASRLSPPRVAVSTAGASVVGPKSAPIQIVVFTDFECPYCRESEQTLKFIREKYGERVALYYLNFPLPSHPNARPAALAAMCAASQGQYTAYHDLLFSHQPDLAHADYAAWAVTAGLDRKKFEACLASGDPDHLVDENIREGIAAGVNGTPTFLVNGRLVTKNDVLLEVVAEEEATTR